MKRVLPVVVLVLIILQSLTLIATNVTSVKADTLSLNGLNGYVEQLKINQNNMWRISVGSGNDPLDTSGDRVSSLSSSINTHVGRITGDNIVYIPIYDKDTAAPGENITVGVVALGATGPIPGKTFNITVNANNITLTTNDQGIAFLNLTQDQSGFLDLGIPKQNIVEHLRITNISTIAISPTIAIFNSSGKDIIKIALVNMTTKRAYSGQLDLNLNIDVNSINGSSLKSLSYNLRANFKDGVAKINATELLRSLSQYSLSPCIDMNLTDCIYKITIYRIGTEFLNDIPDPIYIVESQKLISKLAAITPIVPSTFISTVNKTLQGSIAFLVRQAEYRLLTGTLEVVITMYNRTYDTILETKANLSVNSGIGVLDLGILGEIPNNVSTIHIAPIRFIGKGNETYYIIYSLDLNIEKVSPDPIVYGQPQEGLKIGDIVFHYSINGVIVNVTIYYNGTPLPRVPVKIYIPDPRSPTYTVLTDESGVASFNLTQLYPKIESIDMAFNQIFTFLITVTWGGETVYQKLYEDYHGIAIPRLSTSYTQQGLILNISYPSNIPYDLAVRIGTAVLFDDIQTFEAIVVKPGSSLQIVLDDPSNIYSRDIYLIIEGVRFIRFIEFFNILIAPNFKEDFIYNSTVVGSSIDLSSPISSLINVTGGRYRIVGTVNYVNPFYEDYRIEVYMSNVSLVNGRVQLDRSLIVTPRLYGYVDIILILLDSQYIYDTLYIYVDVTRSFNRTFSVTLQKTFDTVALGEYINYTIKVRNLASYEDIYTVDVEGPGVVNVTRFNLTAGGEAVINLRVGGFRSVGVNVTTVTISSLLSGSKVTLFIATIVIAPAASNSSTISGLGSISLDRISIEAKSTSPVNITVYRLNTTSVPVQVGIPARGIPDLLYDIKVDNASALQYPIWINISYAGIKFQGPEAGLKLYRYNHSAARWEPFRETGVDTARKIVWAKAYPDELVGALVSLVSEPITIVGGELEIPLINNNNNMNIEVIVFATIAGLMIIATYIYIRRSNK